jgi:hypothetical protein
MKEKKIELTFSKNTILENSGLEAFTNDFIYHDDNYFRESIGSLFGVIQILDNSEQSEYIPNLLTNLIKKEFYSQPKRPTEESFEASLKKANLALADLAEHDILKWNNNLHSIVGVFKDQTLYFTQVGSAMIFLGRNNKIINLSEPNLSTNIHPVKTFRDVIVGEIKPNDKIIISTPTIQNIFKLNDLSRLFDTFDSKEFDNLFIKTIKKEARNISVIIINVKEKKQKIIKPESISTINEDAPIDELTKNKNFLGGQIKKAENNNEEEIKKKKGKKIKKKKGKIKQGDTSKNKNATRAENPPLAKIATANFPKQKKKENQKKESTEKNTVTEKKTSSSKTKNKKSLTAPSKENLGTKTFSKNNKSVKKLNDLKPIEETVFSTEISPFEKTPEIYIKSDDNNLQKANKKIPSQKLKKYFSSSKEKKVKNISKEHPQNKMVSEKISSIDDKIINRLSPLLTWTKNTFKNFSQKIFLFSKKLTLPKNLSSWKKNNFFKKENLQNINTKYFLVLLKKYYLIILFVLFIILTPLIISRLHSNKKNASEKQPSPLTKNVPSNNNSVIENKNPVKIIATLETKLNLISENDTVILVSDSTNKLYEIKKENNEKKEIKIPEKINFGNLKTITYMPSLNLFFLSSNSEIISYSPATKKFYPNKITLPSNFDLLDQGTYLDYLYLLDKNSKQIYRYPRATGGFGVKKDWLKVPLKNTDKISSLAVDDHIRLAYFDGTVEKYFKNKLVNTKKFNIKSLRDIYTKDTLQNYYLLDQDSGTIFQINKKNDRVTNKYQNKALTKTNNFSVDEKNKKIYLLNDKNIMAINF